MNLLNGIVSMGCAFWMIIYLYGLKAVSSPKYHYDLFVMPTVLIVISLFCFYFALKDPILKISFLDWYPSTKFLSGAPITNSSRSFCHDIN